MRQVLIFLAAVFVVVQANQVNTILGPVANAIKGGGQGPTFKPGDESNIYVPSVNQQTIFKVNVNTGATSVFVAQPDGEGDDTAFTPSGNRLVWTSLLTGVVRTRLTSGGPVTIIASIPFPNGIACYAENRCIVSQFPPPLGSNLWQVDPTGVDAAVIVFADVPPLNGFALDFDNTIYAPCPITGQIFHVDIPAQTVVPVADGFGDPEGCRFSLDHSILYCSDATIAQIFALDPSNNFARTLAGKVREPAYIDNFAVGPVSGDLYASESANNALYRISSGFTFPAIVKANMGLPGGVAWVPDASDSALYVADYYSIRRLSCGNCNIRQDHFSQIFADSNDAYSRNGEFAKDLAFGIFTIAANAQYVVVSVPFNGGIQVRNRVTDQPLADLYSTIFGYGIAIFPDNSIAVADFGVGIQVFSGANWAHQTTFTVPGFGTVTGLAAVPGTTGLLSAVYFTDWASGTVGKFTFATNAVQVIRTGLNNPEGIVVDGNKLIVAEVGAKKIIKFNASNGQGLAQLATGLNIGLAGSVNMPPPNIFTGLAVDDNHNVFFASDIDDALYFVQA